MDTRTFIFVTIALVILALIFIAAALLMLDILEEEVDHKKQEEGADTGLGVLSGRLVDSANYPLLN